MEDRLPAQDEAIVGALRAHGLEYKGASRMFLQPHGDTTVHRVCYHEGQPDIAVGCPRAQAGAHAGGWYAVVSIRTLDREPDWERVRQIGARLGIEVSREATAGTVDTKVVVLLGEAPAAGLRFYTVSMTGRGIDGLRQGMARVNAVAYELLCEKEIQPKEMEVPDGIGELVNSLTSG